MSTPIRIEPATPPDRDALHTMQAVSFRALGASFYSDDAIDSFISNVGTMDDTLLADGTYFKATENAKIVGSGGWSWRTPAYVSCAAGDAFSPHVRKAMVRSIFVHPDYTRRGIARTIMGLVEAEIAAAGFATASLTATLSGIPLYRSLGYRSGPPVTLALPDKLTFVALAMEKPVASETARIRAA